MRLHFIKSEHIEYFDYKTGEYMGNFVDMHCHIICNVDDGAKDEKDTRQMLEIAYKHGTRTIIATPHHHPIRGNESIEVIARQYKLTKQIASSISKDLNVLLGMEIYFSQDIKDELLNNKLLTMNNSDILLVEFNQESDFDYICSSLKQLQMLGYSIILAHIERYNCFIKNPELVYDIYDLGIYIQVNADSITGKQGFKIKRFVRKILSEELVYCVGSDAHNKENRVPVLDKAHDYVAKKYGNKYADDIFRNNILEVCR